MPAAAANAFWPDESLRRGLAARELVFGLEVRRRVWLFRRDERERAPDCDFLRGRLLLLFGGILLSNKYFLFSFQKGCRR